MEVDVKKRYTLQLCSRTCVKLLRRYALNGTRQTEQLIVFRELLQPVSSLFTVGDSQTDGTISCNNSWCLIFKHLLSRLSFNALFFFERGWRGDGMYIPTPINKSNCRGQRRNTVKLQKKYILALLLTIQPLPPSASVCSRRRKLF